MHSKLVCVLELLHIWGQRTEILEWWVKARVEPWTCMVSIEFFTLMALLCLCWHSESWLTTLHCVAARPWNLRGLSPSWLAWLGADGLQAVLSNSVRLQHASSEWTGDVGFCSLQQQMMQKVPVYNLVSEKQALSSQGRSYPFQAHVFSLSTRRQ